MSPGGRARMRAVPRYDHGSRVPGWDQSVDLTKPPAAVPDPEVTPVPPSSGPRSWRRWRSTPTGVRRRSRRSTPPRALRLVLARSDRSGRRGDAADAGIPDLGGDVLRHARDSSQAAATTCTCARTSRARCAAPMRSSRRCIAAAPEDTDVNVRAFECLGACDIAPMASVNGEYIGPLEPADAAQIVEDLRAGQPVLESKQLRFRQCVDPKVAAGAQRLQPTARIRSQSRYRRTRPRG